MATLRQILLLFLLAAVTGAEHSFQSKQPTQQVQNREEIEIIPLEAHMRARGLITTQPLIEQRRQQKPKVPVGNDLGSARAIETPRRRLADHLEATVSVGFTMSTNQSQPNKDKESQFVAEELRRVEDSAHVPYFIYHRDPEEEALDDRITQVARQLAESAIRKEYEQARYGPLPALFTGKPEYAKQPKKTQDIKPPSEDNLTEVELIQPARKSSENAVYKHRKTGKSYEIANTLPLVSHLPPDITQLQLIAEVQPIPHFLVSEGFPARTPAPELVGPILGGPLRTEEANEERSGKSLEVEKPKRLSSFLKRISPKLGTVSNDVVAGMPMGVDYYPPVVPPPSDWWGRPSTQEDHS